MKFILILSSIVTLSYAQNFAQGTCPNVTEPTDDFKLDKYLGKWYEIARTSNIWEIGLKCVTANYSINDDGTIRVDNRGVNSKGKTSKAIGTARVTDSSNLLKVKFSKFSPEAPYWIAETDFVNYALVISCVDALKIFKFESAWVLYREANVEADKIAKLLDRLETKYGVSKNEMSIVDQSDCPNRT